MAKRKRQVDFEEEEQEVSIEDRIAALERSNAALERQNELLTKRVTDKALKETDGTKRISDKPVLRDAERLEKFLSTEPDPSILYSDSQRLQICVKKGEHLSTLAKSGRVISSPDVIIRFAPYHGPGSDIPRPDQPDKPIFLWGVVNIERVPEVVRGEFSVAELLEMIQATEAYRRSQIFDGKEAQSRIAPEYEYKKRMDAEKRRREERMAALPEGAFKAGSVL